MSVQQRTFLTRQELLMAPTIASGITPEIELILRTQAGVLVTKLGKLMGLTDVCIRHALMTMHRFFVKKSFFEINHYDLGAAAIRLALDNPKRTYGLMANYMKLCNHQTMSGRALQYFEQDLNKASILLKEVIHDKVGQKAADHPHQYIMDYLTRTKAPIQIHIMARSLATLLYVKTRFCLMYEPKVLACFCVYKTYGDLNQAPKKLNGQTIQQVLNSYFDNTKFETMSKLFSDEVGKCTNDYKAELEKLIYIPSGPNQFVLPKPGSDVGKKRKISDESTAPGAKRKSPEDETKKRQTILLPQAVPNTQSKRTRQRKLGNKINPIKNLY